MRSSDLFLAIFITAIWGANFSIVKIGLNSFDPFLLAAIRFALCALPAIFFIPRPNVELRYLFGYGIVFGIFMWGLTYAGIQAGLSPGLASLVLQSGVFFTIAFGVLFFSEEVTTHQIVGTVTAFIGILLLFFITDGSVSILGIALVLCGGAAWGIANTIVKKTKNAEMLGFIVWSSLVSPIPLLLISFFINGIENIAFSIINIDSTAIFSILFQVYPTTLFGYAIWNQLLRKYPLASIAPLSLFVPIFGLLGSVLIFNEQLVHQKIISMALIITGLFINFYGRAMWKICYPLFSGSLNNLRR